MNETAEWECIHTVGVPCDKGAGNVLVQYWQMMLKVVTLNGPVYDQLARSQRLFGTALLNLAVLGALYGFTSAGLSGAVLAEMQPGASFSSLAVTLVGVLTVFLIHGASALFVWVFCRGIGGRSQLSLYYLNTAVASIVLWPAAPLVAFVQVGLGGVVPTAIASSAGVWGIAAMIAAVKSASGLSTVKMTAAVTATVIYTGCFLYLWI